MEATISLLGSSIFLVAQWPVQPQRDRSNAVKQSIYTEDCRCEDVDAYFISKTFAPAVGPVLHLAESFDDTRAVSSLDGL